MTEDEVLEILTLQLKLHQFLMIFELVENLRNHPPLRDKTKVLSL